MKRKLIKSKKSTKVKKHRDFKTDEDLERENNFHKYSLGGFDVRRSY
jgi:hypothetical protein